MRTRRCRIAVLCGVVLLGLIAVLTGTYAWNSHQQARNDVYGSGVDRIPVVLIKQEKLPDGTLSNKALSNAAFYLFQEDGTQIGGRYLTDETGEIRVGLNPGSYYFEESLPPLGYTFDTDENGAPKTKYPFTVERPDLGAADLTMEALTVYVDVCNIPMTGDLLIRKTVENVDGALLTPFQLNQEFSFVVSFSDGGSYHYSVDGVYMGRLDSGGTLQLRHGQTAAFTGIPTGVLYNVIEQTPIGYTVSASGHQGNIKTEQSIASFINRADVENTGSLIVKKEVRGEGAVPGEEFHFTITIDGVSQPFTLQAGGDCTFQGLPLGAVYTVTEDVPDGAAYRPLNRSYTGRIVDTGTVTLPFINVYEAPPPQETGSLTVKKEVRGEGADPEAEFGFEISFNGGEPQSFVLKAGESADFGALPFGTRYVVREVSMPDWYHPTVQWYSGSISAAENLLLPFVNVYDPTVEGGTGSLSVTKLVTGEGADPTLSFGFKASFTHGDSTWEEEFRLAAADGAKTFDNLPHGTQYTVEEIDSAGYTPAVLVAQGTIAENESAAISFVNAAPLIPPPTTGSLVISKIVQGDNPDPSKAFSFTIDFEGENAPEDESFTLLAGDNRSYTDLPAGTSYTVTETDAAGYEAVFTTTQGSIVAGETTELLFTNVVPVEPPPAESISLTVKKEIVGEDADPTKPFEITLEAGELSESFMLLAGDTKEFQLPKGTTYEIREKNYIEEGYSQYITNGSGILTESTLSVVTNTHFREETVEISGVKTWDLVGYGDVSLPESITVHLMSGERLVETKTVTVDASGLWSYQFTVPEYNADGTQAVYSVREEPVSGFRTSYDGYNITNTYIPPLRVTFPTISKRLQGENPPAAEFAFVLRGKTGAPMPAGAEGILAQCTVTGEGETSFGELAFTKPGEYSYLVVEKSLNQKGWECDPATYTVTFLVTENDSGLSCEYKILRKDTEVNEIVFINRYEPVDLTETVTIRGSKVWNHGNNPEGSRPDHVVVQLYANSVFLYEILVTEESNWEYSAELPKYDGNGNAINYTVDEAPVENYRKVVNGYMLINTFESDGPVPTDPPVTPTDPPVVPTDPPVDPDDPTQPEVTPTPSPSPSPGPTPTPTPTPPPWKPDKPDVPVDVPKTGDYSNLPLWIAMMVASAFGLVMTILLGRKPKQKGRHSRRQ